jgi:hypothetical protein
MILRLTRNESLVLFELLSRLDGKDSLPHDHPAEVTVLQKLLGQLESTLAEPFAPNYKEIVDEARKNVVEGEEPS